MEFVYVVERRQLFDLHFPHGLVAAVREPDESRTYLDRIRRHGFFVERRKAEIDSSLKQIIPYVVVRQAGERGVERVLLLQRTARQGEARLHGKLSIGIGGHINPIDRPMDGPIDGAEVLRLGMQREIDEELDVEGKVEYRVAGFLNDDSTPVGSVHFGLVVVAHAAPDARVAIRETDKMEGRFVTETVLLEAHRSERARFETWSALLVDAWAELGSTDRAHEIDLDMGRAASA